MYKGGQAGVTKATVTITFDNGEKDQSPVGYEMYDEIVVSRQVSPSDVVLWKHVCTYIRTCIDTFSSSLLILGGYWRTQ